MWDPVWRYVVTTRNKIPYKEAVMAAEEIKELKLDGGFTLVKEDKAEKWAEYAYNDKDAFKTALEGAGIKESQYKAVLNLEKEYSKKAAEAANEFSIKTLKKDKSLDSVTCTLPFGGNGKITTDLTREISGINRLTGKPYRQSKFTVRHTAHLISGTFIRGLRDAATEQLVK